MTAYSDISLKPSLLSHAKTLHIKDVLVTYVKVVQDVDLFNQTLVFPVSLFPLFYILFFPNNT